MKNLIFMLLLAGSIGGVYAQNAEKKDKFSPDTPLFEELTNVKKKTDKFNLYLNMQGSLTPTSGMDFRKVILICTSSASKRKGISTTGCHTVTASASTARMMPTA